MCGICGLIYHDKKLQVEPEAIHKMNSVLEHRGPDQDGFYIKHNVGLGHRRLSIIDLGTGRQPISNENDKIWVVFNGEIYNYIEIKQHLIKKGHVFKTDSDTEVIIHLYEEEGLNFTAKLRGMFAIAIWDENQEKLILARDRLGKKPVFYCNTSDTFVFASEIKSILQVKGIERSINYQALDSYLSFQYIPYADTIFSGIRKLPAGHILVFQDRSVSIKKYWELTFPNRYEFSDKYYENKLSEILYEAVKIRLRSDVPLGAFLSGGVDSSVVVSYMAKILDRPVETCSIGFDDKEFNELPYARQVASLYDCHHHEFYVTPKVRDLVPKLIWYFDEPFADCSAIPTYYVSKIAREKVTVVLSGDGGDEIFAGYPRYFIESVEQNFRKVINYLPNRIYGTLYNILDPYTFKGKNILKHLGYSSSEAYAMKHSHQLFDNELKRKLYTASLNSVLTGYDSLRIFRKFYNTPHIDDNLNKALYTDTKISLVDDMLVKVDRMSMANSLEVRSPLLDHELIEFMAKVPPDLKLRGNNGKYILKRKLPVCLGKNFIKRKKQGFDVPIVHWLKNELKEMAEDILLGPQIKRHGYFKHDFVEKLWNHFIQGRNDYAYMLWLIMIFEIWHDIYIDRKYGL